MSSIEIAVNEIAQYPYAAPVFEELNEVNESIRVKSVKGVYKIVYRVEGNIVGIIDILHSAQDAEKSISEDF